MSLPLNIRKMNLCSFLLLSVSLVWLAAASPTSTPKLVFQRNYSWYEQTLGIYTSPRGVDGDSSPFVVAGDFTLTSFSASGDLLKKRSFLLTDNSLKMLHCPPLMNTDAKENTLFVAAQSNAFSRINVTAFDARTLETRWSQFPADLCESAACENKAMVYVKPSLASMCPNGAGAVSVLTCTTTDSVAHCSVRLLDFHSGALCGAPRYVPNSKELNPDSVIYRSFPADGQLIRPMIVAQNNNAGKLFGIDAVSGMVTYSASSPSNVQGFAAGVSPANDMLAFWASGAAYNPEVFFVDIATGKTKFSSQTAPRGWNDLVGSPMGWTSLSGTNSGGVTLLSSGSAYNASLVTISADTGNVTYREVTNYGKIPLFSSTAPVLSVGPSWTMVLLFGSPYTLELFGVSTTSSTRFSAMLPRSAIYYDPFNGFVGSGLTSFTFTNGTTGVANFMYSGITQHNGIPTNKTAVISVFSV